MNSPISPCTAQSCYPTLYPTISYNILLYPTPTILVTLHSVDQKGLLESRGLPVEEDAFLIYVEQANDAIGAVPNSDTTCLFDGSSDSHDLQKGPCINRPLSATPHIRFHRN